MYEDDADDWLPSWYIRRRYPFLGRFYFNFADQFNEMHKYLQHELEELAKKTPKYLRQRVLPDGSKIEEWGPFVYGYTMKIGPDGKPKIREFGNIKRSSQFGNRAIMDIKKEREPLVDVTVTDGNIIVVAELPGVDKTDIKLHGTEDTLTISVDKAEYGYYKEVELPNKVDVKKAKSTFKNGVLEVTLPIPEDGTKGENIQID